MKSTTAYFWIIGFIGGLTVLTVACKEDPFEGAPTATAPPKSEIGDLKPERGPATRNLPGDHPPVGNEQSGLKKTQTPKTRRGNGNQAVSFPFQWSAPSTWTKGPAQKSGSISKQTYLMGNGDNELTLEIFNFGPGRGGSVEANIQRWKGQFESAQANKSSRTVREIELTLLDVTGTFNPSQPMNRGDATEPQEGYRMLGAVAESGEQRVFFKLVGPEGTVSEHKSEFKSFLNSLRPASN